MVMRRRVNFFGIPVDDLTSHELIERLDHSVSCRSKCQIVPLNANKLWLAEKDAKLRDVLLRTELVVPEYSVVWGGRVLGTPFAEHLGGIMLMRRMLIRAQQERYRVYFLGARDDIVQSMVNRLRAGMPGLIIAGWDHGYFQSEDEAVGLIDKSD